MIGADGREACPVSEAVTNPGDTSELANIGLRSVGLHRGRGALGTAGGALALRSSTGSRRDSVEDRARENVRILRLRRNFTS
jgi:hypothetical protein